MSEPTSYRTLSQPSLDHIFKDKGSKFFGYAYPVEQIDQISLLIDLVKSKHPRAQHCCYAWTLGLGASTRYRVNDDGEPKNSAGQPIYGQILSKGLSNTIVMVVRYFGGTKLGVSGLINAYRTTAELALENASLVSRKIQFELRLNFKYQDLNKVMRIIKGQNLQITSQKMELACEFVLAVNASEFDTVLHIFESQTGVEVQKI